MWGRVPAPARTACHTAFKGCLKKVLRIIVTSILHFCPEKEIQFCWDNFRWKQTLFILITGEGYSGHFVCSSKLTFVKYGGEWHLLIKFSHLSISWVNIFPPVIITWRNACFSQPIRHWVFPCKSGWERKPWYVQYNVEVYTIVDPVNSDLHPVWKYCSSDDTPSTCHKDGIREAPLRTLQTFLISS